MNSFIDLFCGIGGFRVALQKKGLKCVFSSDVDKYVQDAYEENFGDRPEGDITKISATKIPKHDILCAGFPCQSFSISGDMQGLKDNRGRLFYEIVRIAEHHKPKILLLENVKNILTVGNDKSVIKTIKKELDRIGYHLHISILNSSLYGIPQKRERVYFIGLRKSKFKASYFPPAHTNEQIYLKDILENDIDKSFFITRDDIDIKTRVSENKLKPIRVGTVNKGGQGERIYSINGHSITLSAYGGGVGARTGLYLVDDGVRKLTKNECKKLMSFDATHYVSDGIQGYQQIGNAVMPAMIEQVYDSITLQ